MSSTSGKIGPLLAQVQLVLIRLAPVTSVATLLCLSGAIAWVWGVPHIRAQLRAQQQVVSAARATLSADVNAKPVIQRTVAEEHLAHFYSNLGERGYMEQQVKTLFAIAVKNNLTLSQAEYKPAFDKSGNYHTYQISLPVKGPYGALRQFCEQTLLTVPFASLDEISFKREGIGSRTVEAKLRFTLYLANSPTPSPAMSDVGKFSDE